MIAGLAASALHGSKWVDDDATRSSWSGRTLGRRVSRAHRDDMLLRTASSNGAAASPLRPPNARHSTSAGGDGLGEAVARLDALAQRDPVSGLPMCSRSARAGHRHTPRPSSARSGARPNGSRSRVAEGNLVAAVGDSCGLPATADADSGAEASTASGMYYLDMGWEDIMLALEYDGGQHWDNSKRIAYDIKRAEDLREIGWHVVHVMKEHRAADVLNRLGRAWPRATR